MPRELCVVTYEKCNECHLFIERNDDRDIADGAAEYVHNHRGDRADEAIEATHEAKPSGLIATLDVWERYGPPAMRARFHDADTAYEPDFIGVRLLCGTSWATIDTDAG